MLIIKDAQIDDIAEITILMNELGYPTSIIEMTGRFKMIAEHIDYKTIIAVLNGEIVGMAAWRKGYFMKRTDFMSAYLLLL